MSRSSKSGLLMFISGMTIWLISLLLYLHDKPFVLVIWLGMFLAIAGGFIFVET